MIKLKNIKHDKETGIITVIFECDGDGIWYNVTIDTKTWTVSSTDDVSSYLLAKCKFKLRDVLLEKGELPSEEIIMWY